MSVLLNTLYVTAEGAYVRKDHQTIAVEVERERKLTVPIHHIGAIVCFGNVNVSPWAMSSCMESDVAITFLTAEGRFLARVEGPPRGNVLLRRAQYRLADDDSAKIEVVQSFVAGKLHNATTLCRRLARDCENEDAQSKLAAAADRIAHMLSQATHRCDTIDMLRGCEGNAGAAYWEAFSKAIRRDEPEMQFTTRNRRPPQDRPNALLSFLYALLHNDCAAALNTVGLDPAVGYLHTDRPGRLSLALDLMEEFRPALADRLALTLLNRRQLDADDFVVEPSGAVRLTDDARKTVLVAYQKRKQDEVTHPFTGQRLALGLVPHLQARLLARMIRGELDAYPPFAIR